MNIHPSAVIAEGARIPKSCTIGPYCTIGPEVELGEDCTLISHVVLDGRTRIGARNTFHPFCAVGVAPQDRTLQNRSQRSHPRSRDRQDR